VWVSWMVVVVVVIGLRVVGDAQIERRHLPTFDYVWPCQSRT
jgi:hypothetical protein